MNDMLGDLWVFNGTLPNTANGCRPTP